MKKKTLMILLPAILFLSYSVLLTNARADGGTYAILEGIGTLGKGSTPGFKDYMTEILKVGIAIAGLLAVAELVVGGIQYVLSAASEKQAAAGKERIQNALIGLIIGICGYLILNVINPDIISTGSLKIDPIPSSTVSPH